MTNNGFCACDATELHPVSECVRPGVSNDEVAADDVRVLLDALGLGTHARPYSAHAVIHRDLLPAIRGLHQFAADMVNAPDDSAADWGYDLAHRLGLLDLERPRECTCLPAGPTCDPCEAHGVLVDLAPCNECHPELHRSQCWPNARCVATEETD